MTAGDGAVAGASAAAAAAAPRARSRSRERAPAPAPPHFAGSYGGGGGGYGGGGSGSSSGYGGGGFGGYGGGGGGSSSSAPPPSGAIDTRALIAAAKAAASASAGSALGSLAATKTVRRLHLGGVAPTSEGELGAFFNAILARAHAPGDYVLAVTVNAEKKFAFIEFRTVEAAGMAMQLDGVSFKGQPLRVRRPNDHNAALVAGLVRGCAPRRRQRAAF